MSLTNSKSVDHCGFAGKFGGRNQKGSWQLRETPMGDGSYVYDVLFVVRYEDAYSDDCEGVEYTTVFSHFENFDQANDFFHKMKAEVPSVEHRTFDHSSF